MIPDTALTALKGLVRVLSPAGRWARLSVLIYHRVVEGEDPLVPWGIDSRIFESHMAALSRCFNVLPLREAVDRFQVGSLPAAAAAVTFDDGYRDNLTVALPILQRHRIPATVFVASGFLDGGRMWNDTISEALRRTRVERLDLSDLGFGCHDLDGVDARRRAVLGLLGALKYRPLVQRQELVDRIAERCGTELPEDLMMSSAEVRALDAAGAEIGGHTVHHPILATLDDAGARFEIAEGKERLEAITGHPLHLFAYPNGRPGKDYGMSQVRAVAQSGFAAAVTTAKGAARRGDDAYQIPRFTPWDRDPRRFILRLAANLLGGRAARV